MIKPVYLLLFFALIVPLPAQTKDTLLFEITTSLHSGLKRSSTIFYFYRSGRIDCQKESKSITNRIARGQKSKCHQLSRAKIMELTQLAGQADFQAAKESYDFFSGGIDWGSSCFITYHQKAGQKNINLSFTDRALEPIPASLKTFLQKIGELDKRLKVSDE